MSPLQRMIIDFEQTYWHRLDSKENAIRETFDMTPVRYYQLLLELIDEPEALAAEPLLVNRLRRIANSRAAARSDVA